MRWLGDQMPARIDHRRGQRQGLCGGLLTDTRQHGKGAVERGAV
jgi:hypothetical protein